jgi:hypothetical protein
MNFETLQKAWQSQDAGAKMTIDADVLLKEVRRNQQQFRAMIFWRDVREIGGNLIMVPLWIYLGRKLNLPWTWYLAIPALLWAAGFMLADRIRQGRRQPKPGDPLRDCIESSLALIEHQIWLLRNVFWWALLPLNVPAALFLGHLVVRHHRLAALSYLGSGVALTVLTVWGIYWLNQFAVRKALEPRRQELKTLLNSLDENSH